MKNKQKGQRLIYKRWWFWIIAVVVLTVGFNFVSGTNDHADSTKSKENASSTTKTTQDNIEQAKKHLKKNLSENDTTDDENAITKKQFEAISIGEDGSTMESLKKKFGDPDSQSETTISNVKANQLVWKGVAKAQLASAVTVSFSDGHAISKGITGLKVNHQKEIDADKFESITDGMSEDEVIKKLGDPDGYSETNISGTATKVLTYSSNIKGDMAANFNITLTNGSVSDKKESGLE